MRIFCDASYDIKRQVAGIGIHFSPSPALQCDVSLGCSGLYDGNHAELLAVYLSLRQAQRHGIAKVDVVTDSDHAERLCRLKATPLPHRVYESTLLSAILSIRTPVWTLSVIKGHRGLAAPENTHCDGLAKEAMRKLRDGQPVTTLLMCDNGLPVLD